MKKTLIALAALGAASSFAFAESNVTLYGVIDAGVVVQNPTTGGNLGARDGDNYSWSTPTTVSMESGFRTGSRWGIKGTEDLGNGNSVGFVLEQRFKMDTGANDTAGIQFFGESSLLASGNWGQVGFGRFGSLGSGTGTFNMLTGWALGTNYSGGGTWNAFAGTVRANNAIGYLSPNFGGLQIGLGYSNGVTDDTARWSSNSHYYGIGAKYAANNIKSSLIFEVQDNKGTNNLWNSDTENKIEVKNKALYTVNFGAEYTIGNLTPMFAYQFQNQNDYFQAHTFGLSLAANVAGGKALLGTRYRMMKLKGMAKADMAKDGEETKGNLWTINAAYEYPLSKRTTLWTYAGWSIGNKLYKGDYLALYHSYYYNNDKGEKVADALPIPGTAAALSKASDAAKYNGWVVGLGMTHTF